MHLLTPSENERYGIARFKREPGEIVASKTSVRVCLHMRNKGVYFLGIALIIMGTGEGEKRSP